MRLARVFAVFAGLFLLAGIACPAAAKDGSAAPNTLTEPERKAGWRLLFDGKSLKGWRNFRKDEVSSGWQIEDGALKRAKGGAGDIITRDQFDAFELSLEYKIAKGGNSGIMFHVTEEESTPWRTGPEIQIQDNVDGHDPQKAGWLYQLYAAEDDATKPAGEWNHVQIRIHPEQSVIYMNGYRYARFQKGSEDWNERVAKSKFAKMPKFGKADRGHIALQDHGNPVAFRNIKIRPLAPGKPVPNPIDGTLAIQAVPAFTQLKYSGWSPVDERGKLTQLRPIVLTHAGDGSDRIFLATQRGVIHAFENRQDAKQTKVFLDITKKVSYKDNENEEGLLGLAFHPQYKKNGQFFIYYTTTAVPHTSIISRFRVSPDNPDQADAEFEAEILRIKQPFWNHNGGTIAFGPDGYLYVGLGDGGKANDPYEHAQNLGTLLGSILRIDVDRKQGSLGYAIPKDNPFAGKQDARGEIWAYGLRNVWRMSFDRQTGALWAADVGQNLWEEINLVRRGGNYGWNLREASHPFGPEGTGASPDLIDPIWEYDHEVGKSITGGNVYRGERLPELQGAYLYGDYVTGLVWALRYDEKTGQVSNHAIQAKPQPIISFGEDESGEVYYTAVTGSGKGIFRFERAEKAAAAQPRRAKN